MLFNPGCAIILPPVYERVRIMRDSKPLDAMSKKTLHRGRNNLQDQLGVEYSQMNASGSHSLYRARRAALVRAA